MPPADLLPVCSAQSRVLEANESRSRACHDRGEKLARRPRPNPSLASVAVVRLRHLGDVCLSICLAVVEHVALLESAIVDAIGARAHATSRRGKRGQSGGSSSTGIHPIWRIAGGRHQSPSKRSVMRTAVDGGGCWSCTNTCLQTTDSADTACYFVAGVCCGACSCLVLFSKTVARQCCRAHTPLLPITLVHRHTSSKAGLSHSVFSITDQRRNRYAAHALFRHPYQPELSVKHKRMHNCSDLKTLLGLNCWLQGGLSPHVSRRC